ncbi:unnamed protein product (mitochondrion) [Plasmodiophora brassicae]|uniref:Uncharacterized protein n=1 Tax=Plasmodiophora brassicae TaxID=37360 RepID=A0A0G4IKE5_PLABS|nr:hypothetical protein PBRA_004281 [Plasmodiophora brassicae]SPR00428.1 unnamed protein product [Plasmodiophora brassicae]
MSARLVRLLLHVKFAAVMVVAYLADVIPQLLALCDVAATLAVIAVLEPISRQARALIPALTLLRCGIVFASGRDRNERRWMSAASYTICACSVAYSAPVALSSPTATLSLVASIGEGVAVFFSGRRKIVVPVVAYTALATTPIV